MQSDIRRTLLEMFTNSKEEYVSGQKISDMLGCSRTAVWKHIEDLRKEGYELEAVRKKGYRIVNKPNKVSENELILGLQTKKIGQHVHYEEVVESTQKIAHRLAQEGVQEGTVVVAEEQTSGRGRLDRVWHSPKGTGVWMSIILRPTVPPQNAPQLTLLTAVAVVQAIQEVTGISPQIKWPNDILIEGKKAVGILTEMQADADRIHSVIIGIGINVNQQQQDFSDAIKDIATSLAAETGELINRATLMQTIFLKIESLYEEYLKNGFGLIKVLWETYAISIGKRIIARTLRGSIEGWAKGITEDGVLLVEDDLGVLHHIHSADIELSTRK
ncbi:biotin--[acetyl-CoA-carboxylase] ligase [Metabacillus iocasae]|uniref:Bifunctional ligase/repressor BirA n=1 Tax=Priestia iocasae TaxID=2291674 RepID=A0ABS2QV17_9BACI|nr:biotin--[acetyl-CoA-carboxylase] ligase [Metabacillus iocasae]MBM7703333.1 BirA family biotin operon repressor/biotin-[acetyl-CoA-carboxylase] ligase [Metabacillus iocasae]